jgi:outer membrane protein assembly factor BamA
MNRIALDPLRLLLLILTLAVAPALPQTGSEAPPAKIPGQIDSAKASEKKGEWLLAPIPINSPAIGAGLEWAVARVFPINKRDEVSPPSTVGVGGVFTNNGSKALALGGRIYLKQDRYRLATAFGTASVNADIYGVGKVAGDKGTYVPLNTDGTGFLGEALYGIRKGVFIGVRSQWRNLRLSLDQEKLNDPDRGYQAPEDVAKVIEQIGQELLRQQTVSFGPRFQWDTRDSTFYPKKGLFMDLNMDFFSTGVGSKWSYQYYKVGFNKYNSIGEHSVIAFRGMGCAAFGDRVPIYDLCLFGSQNDIRGYSAGRYQDRRMFATQAEYRYTLPFKGFMGKFGVVGFVGVGAVGRTYGDMAWGDLLPGGGAGVRFRMLKKQPINFRVDYGLGKVGHTLSIGILEAF